MFQSKFNRGYLLATSLVISLFFLLSVFLMTHHELEKVKNVALMDLFAFGLFVAGLFFVYQWSKKMLVCRIDGGSLSLGNVFGRRVLIREEIRKMDVDARVKPGVISNGLGSGIRIETNDGTVVELAAVLYRDAPLLKQQLHAFFTTGKLLSAPMAPVKAGPVPPGEEEDAVRYAGNPFLCVNSLTFCACVVIMFMVTLYRRSNALTITTGGYYHTRYSAGSLGDSDWDGLFNALQSKNIDVVR